MVGFSVGFAVEARNGVGLAGVGLGLRFSVGSPTAKPAAWGCRARSLLVGHRNEFG